MDPAIWVVFMAVIIVLLMKRRRAVQRRRKRSRRRRAGNMSQAIIEQLLGKRCIFDMEGLTSVTGVLEKLDGNWLSLRMDDKLELVNLDYVTRIRELPEKKRRK